MSKYATNPTVATASKMAHLPNTRNLAGGDAHQQSTKLELASIVLTSFLKDQFYRTEKDTVARLNELMAKVDPLFIAKLAVFARHEYGMRSVSHYLAAWIGNNVHREPWLRKFYKAVIRRPDDILEILGCYIATKPTVPHSIVVPADRVDFPPLKAQRLRLPNAMKRGLGDKLSTIDAYGLGKYRKDNADLSMVDAVNLCHPKPTPALTELIKGQLATVDTWETAISAAGQNTEGELDAEATKSEEWERLVSEKKLGYFALLRNIRNICTHAPNFIDELCQQLVDREAIKKSLVLPFRYLTAIDVVQKDCNPHQSIKLMAAITDAVDIALENVPVLPGRTCVVLDDSGSMQGVWLKATMLAAAIVRVNSADLLIFDSSASWAHINVRNPILSIAGNIPFGAGGTDFHCIFPALTESRQRYDRVIILSDMQGWIGDGTPRHEYLDYCKKIGADPKVYSIDLAGYGTMQFPESNVYCMAGFSEKIFDTMKLLEHDRDALINQINATEL